MYNVSWWVLSAWFELSKKWLTAAEKLFFKLFWKKLPSYRICNRRLLQYRHKAKINRLQEVLSNETDEQGNLLPPNMRVTKFGRFVRRTSLDELLNFWSIFKGDMSIIGPRPLPIDYEKFYSDRHMTRFSVRPGLECPIIQQLGDNVTWLDRFEQEVYYVENVSLLLDIKMIFAIIKIAFNKKSRNMRGSATGGSFMGYRKDGTCINSQSVEVEYYHEAVRRMGYSDRDVDITLGGKASERI